MELKTWLRAQWDRVVGGVGVAAGVLAILLGYLGVKDTPYPAEQIPYVISGGVLGLALIGIGLTLWLSADLRDEWHKLDRIERLLEGGQVDVEQPAAGATPNDLADGPAFVGTGNGHADAPGQPTVASGQSR